MAQYYTDFGDSSTGGYPDGWSSRWNPSSWDVVEDANARGGQRVEHTGSTTERHAIVWDDRGSIADLECWCRIRLQSDSNTQGGLRARVQGSTGNETGYGCEFDFANGGLAISEYDNGTWTSAIGVQSISFTTGEWWNIRFNLSGSTLNAVAWPESEPEPSSWGASAEGAITSAGDVGFGAWEIDTKSIDAFGVGTNGDPAPTTDPSVPVTGNVSLDDGTALEGAQVIGINDDEGVVDDVTTTDANGDYTLQMTPGSTAHVVMKYDDGTDQYQSESKPFIVVSE